MKKSIITEAIRISKLKLDKHPEYDNYPHFSFIVVKNKILGYGTNLPYPPKKNYGYEARIQGGVAKLHSEIVAWKRCKSLIQGANFEIVNIRLNRNSELRDSCPCSCCMNLLTTLGCSRFYFSTSTSFFLKTI